MSYHTPEEMHAVAVLLEKVLRKVVRDQAGMSIEQVDRVMDDARALAGQIAHEHK